MRDKFFAMYTRMYYTERYLRHYQIHNTRVNLAITIFCAIASTGSVATWALWNKFPYIWGLIIVVSQIIEIVHPHMPYADQHVAFKFILPQLTSLLVDIGNSWRCIDIETLDDKEVNVLLNEYEHRWDNLNSQFLEGVYIPSVSRYIKKARIECNNYFYQQYNVKEGM